MRGFPAQRQGGRPCDLSSLHGGGSGGGSGRGWSCGGGALGSPVLTIEVLGGPCSLAATFARFLLLSCDAASSSSGEGWGGRGGGGRGEGGRRGEEGGRAGTGGAWRSVTVGPGRSATSCARAKGIVVCVRRLASEVRGAVAAVLVVAAQGGDVVVRNDVMVRCPPRRTVVMRTRFQPAS